MHDVQPIVIGDALRRTIVRSIMNCFKGDLQIVAGIVQMCLGQKRGIEHDTHALRRRFFEGRTEAIHLIDVRNAFYRLNKI